MKVPSSLSFEEFLIRAAKYFAQSRKDFMSLGFKTHDLNGDGVIDLNDCYDIMYLASQIKTDACYNMHKDAATLSNALAEAKTST